MLLVLHIGVGILSLVLATVAIVAPSVAKLRATYGLIAATLTSGTWLVIASHAPIMSSCLSGLMYLAVAGLLVFYAQSSVKKLTKNM